MLLDPVELAGYFWSSMSKRLDDELSEAIKPRDDESDSPGVVKPVAARPAPARPAPQRNVGVLVTLFVMVAGILALVFLGFKDSAVYAVSADKLSESKDLWARKVRVEGELVPGTLKKQDNPCEYQFTMHGEKAQIPVRYAQCVIPDTFRDMPGGGVQVTVEGQMTGDGKTFEASLVMAKCASKYDPKTHKMEGDKAAKAEPIN